MKLRSLASTVVVALLVTLPVTAGVAVAKKGKQAPGPQVVGTDDAGDWGSNVDPMVSHAYLPNDTMLVLETYVVPKGKKG